MKGFQVNFIYFLLFNSVFYVKALEDDYSITILDNFMDNFEDLTQNNKANFSYAKFSLRKPSMPDNDICYVVPGIAESLKECKFKSTSKTFLVIHGWTVSGLFESWVGKLVSALYEREQDANVIVVDWLYTAQNHYPVVAQKTKIVGQEIAHFIDWLEEATNIHLKNLHLIGYSLGAHVAGFAGSHTSNKVGRITGLDPAGPDFEGEHAHRRLSPDDAHFVDVLHTFSQGSLGLSIGIQQPVGHVDIYPNGGSFQPGCNRQGTLETISKLGLFGDVEDLKLTLKEKTMTNKIHSFLLVTEKDIGDLLIVTFKWEESTSLSTSFLLKMFSSWWSGDSEVAVHKIHIRVGETQKKMVFCIKHPHALSVQKEVTFVKCRMEKNSRMTLENL
ncbi:hypothetical protein UPYG_G00036360 [Umbra pygmaea]|uniref:Lipase domain-containing protein n=1 Tax=Umbra pygmaea TaxID=75934 RepID=A0ABD0XNZ6_UMBPY